MGRGKGEPWRGVNEKRKLGVRGKGEDDGIWVVAKYDRDKRPELAGLLSIGELGGESEGCWGLGSGARPPQSSGAASRRTSFLLKVSHSPISACHAESENFIFWQGES